MTLDDYIRKHADDAKFTVSGLAKDAGLSHSQLNRLRHGTSRPSLKAIQGIHQATGGTVTANDWLEVAQ